MYSLPYFSKIERKTILFENTGIQMNDTVQKLKKSVYGKHHFSASAWKRGIHTAVNLTACTGREKLVQRVPL